MRRLASGTILYGYDSVKPARQDLPEGPVWVAPNSLYRQATISVTNNGPRREFLYVGRFEPAKKIDLLLHAFASSRLKNRGYKLTLVGHGSQEERLRSLAIDLDLSGAINFIGPSYDPQRLSEIYSHAICSVSPGYAGLSLTQSIGFGVPVAVADDEPHSPEIELHRTGAVRFFASDSPDDLAAALLFYANTYSVEAAEHWSEQVAHYYSAEAMAHGLVSALLEIEQQLDTAGWPKS